MPNRTIYVRKDDFEAFNAVREDLPDIISRAIRQEVIAKNKFQEIDALLNDGLLVEVARVFDEPLYIRVNHRDPEEARRKIAEVRSIVKDVVMGEASNDR